MVNLVEKNIAKNAAMWANQNDLTMIKLGGSLHHQWNPYLLDLIIKKSEPRIHEQ
tara:strand:+ start:2121 stop:2285 length:165 start_codon:yes stop_codon:yes gene_type:complete